MDYSITAKEILEKVGGETNIVSASHCMTRLRLILKDESIVHDEEVKAIKGVAGVMKKAGQYQIVIGNDVANCFKVFIKLGNFDNQPGSAPAPKKGGNPVSVVLDAISGSMSPVIPAIIGAGMIKVLIIILGWFINSDNQTMQLLNVIGDSAFYFLPILVGYSAGRKFGANPVLVATVIAVLIHPNFTALVASGLPTVHFLGIPVTVASYSSTVIPAILTAWVMSYIERGVEKITPAFTKNFLKPMLIIIISAPVAFLLLGPLGTIIGNGLAAVLVAIQSHASIAAYVIMAAAMPFIVMTGMHWAFVPLVIAALGTPAGETLMLPAMLISNLAQGAACLAVAIKSKNGNLKQLAASSSVSALFAGVTEPGLYGVTMPLKKPLIALCISSGITGLFAGIMKVSASSFASPSLLSLPIFVSTQKANNFIMTIVTAVIAIVLTFVMTWIMGFKDTTSTEK
ncbi:PTS transporter subunit EIIC [Anaerocolumna xylanovorans]|uniref:PTS system, beta-glucosides-specific IIC component n=1 Tax=Anaerocolumna xylanovorans DSM 12503 TaxID=1121345 RepID=A0A1M7Y0W0_9FIRM|nr:PTS transporter subunit EIIC [Anaerocolumna xylanovorans]SHO45288.1 PTS system, beta-glucosides-specific IIC component [Anaerocolumna xylanovorans DSM 12503]